jgi:predicted nucleic acid-binding protein
VDINLLPDGTACLIDANIFIYYLSGVSFDCKAFLLRVVQGEIQSHITTTIIAEVLHRRMIGEAVAKGLVTPSKALSKLKANPSLITSLTDYGSGVTKLVQLPIQVIEVKQDDINRSQTLRQTHGLFVNDSINLACAERRGIRDIVTHDSDFERVQGIHVWRPTDI